MARLGFGPSEAEEYYARHGRNLPDDWFNPPRSTTRHPSNITFADFLKDKSSHIFPPTPSFSPGPPQPSSSAGNSDSEAAFNNAFPPLTPAHPRPTQAFPNRHPTKNPKIHTQIDLRQGGLDPSVLPAKRFSFASFKNALDQPCKQSRISGRTAGSLFPSSTPPPGTSGSNTTPIPPFPSLLRESFSSHTDDTEGNPAFIAGTKSFQHSSLSSDLRDSLLNKFSKLITKYQNNHNSDNPPTALNQEQVQDLCNKLTFIVFESIIS